MINKNDPCPWGHIAYDRYEQTQLLLSAINV